VTGKAQGETYLKSGDQNMKGMFLAQEIQYGVDSFICLAGSAGYTNHSAIYAVCLLLAPRLVLFVTSLAVLKSARWT
jgi:hypothetical protein